MNVLRFALLGVIFWLPVTSTNAQQKSAPRPQTPRQALIEMITKGGDTLTKHLTVEVQQLLLKPENKSKVPLLMTFGSARPEGIETFEAGDVLLSYSEPRQNLKYEVRVDDDDMAGTEDTMSFSIHALRDGKEEDSGFGMLSTHFSISMKQQQNIWRLDKISVGADFPVGDPEFVQKMLLRDRHQTEYVTGTSAGAAGASDNSRREPAKMPVPQVVMRIGLAETFYARLHPETGFACSLAELSKGPGLVGVDPTISGGTYNGYHIALSGCDGKPAGSYQVFAEPITPAAGSKAFCSDATQNIRSLEGGTGASCLAFGKVEPFPGGEGVGFDLAAPVHTTEKPEKKPE
jgi:hypothetical protein